MFVCVSELICMCVSVSLCVCVCVGEMRGCVLYVLLFVFLVPAAAASPTHKDGSVLAQK